ncbi:hypothetical protein XA68_17825 [Ophiocordyceps unilateralis]|uniref:Sulfatase-modifying factor enzyme-like domain-containing protein n=1 Tax=Ophiocordyceps unilateralis TaxID=268505 RepID=A0A2A9P455_OPHUN|nr:hypothetical protein XA68_17825 [Ophiocordyceps unilateralis]
MSSPLSIILALLTTVGAIISDAEVVSTSLAERKLKDLSESLRWGGTTLATYAPVVPAAREAYSTLKALKANNNSAVPRADSYIETLGRLVVESGYILEESRNRSFQAALYDTAALLTASVNEWHYTIDVIIANLTQPETYRAPQPGSFSNGDDTTIIDKPGTVFRDWPDGPAMVVIPTGTYTAGATDAELEEFDVPVEKQGEEKPQRKVHISKPLAFSQTEVQVWEFAAFVRESHYKPRGGARWWDPADPAAQVFNPELNYLNPGFPQTKNSPVVAITRQDAFVYCNWLSVGTGHTYRLPTEDEWEWAARGGTNTTFFWGHDFDLVYLYANAYDQTSKAVNMFPWEAANDTDGYAYTAPVASFRPNGYDLYDMTANAREFVADDWVEFLGPSAANDGSIHQGPAPFPVLRGGAWNYEPRNLRISYRDGYFSSEVSSNMFGLRLVREL